MSDDLLPPAVAAARRLDDLDPRSRILAAVATVSVAVALHRPDALVASLVVGLAAAAAIGTDRRALAHRLAHVEGFLVVLVLLLPLTVPGPPLVEFGPLALTGPGLRRALDVVLRVNLAAIAIFVLLAGLEPVRLGHALARLGLPEKLVHVFLFAVRWIELLGDEASRLRDALRARGFVARLDRHGLRTLGHFAGRLLVRSLERAERVDEAMRCRGFSGRLLLVATDRYRSADAVFAALLAAGLSAILAWDRLA